MGETPSPGTSPSNYCRPYGKRRKLSRKAIDNIASRRDDRVVTVCGCIVIPQVIGRLIGSGTDSVMCPEHGWQAVEHRATWREVQNAAKGLPLDTQPEPLPDEPPF